MLPLTRHIKDGCKTKLREGTLFGKPKVTWEVADFSITRKWKLLFVNGCECMAEFHGDGIFKLVPNCDKYINLLVDCVGD